ncbi:MAG: N-acetylmuramoyl-L-alanine amidase [Bacillota bacterium]
MYKVRGVIAAAILATVATCFAAGMLPISRAPAVFAQATQQGRTAVVIPTQANLRKTPSLSGAVLALLKAGQELEVLAEQGDWLKVRYQGQEAWIHKSVVEVKLDKELILATVTATSANLRQGPGTSYAIVGRAAKSQTFRALGVRTGWVKVEFSPGKTAWISDTLVSMKALDEAMIKGSPRPKAAVAVADTSLRFSPADFSGVVATVREGTGLKYETSKNSWVLVQTPRGQRGWLDATDVKLYDTVPFGESVNYRVETDLWEIKQFPLVKVKSTANLRAGPGTNHKVLAKLTPGTMLKLLDQGSGWYKVSTPQGTVGWIASYLTAPHSRPAVVSVRVEAKTPQSKLLIVEGGLTSGYPFVSPKGTGVGVFLQDPGARAGFLELNSYDLVSLSVGPSGVWLSTSQWPKVELVEKTSSRIVFEICTEVTGITLSGKQDRDVLFIEARGFMSPTVTWNETSKVIEVTAPGARYTGSTRTFNGNFAGRVSVTTSSFSVRIESKVGPRYVAREIAGGLQFELLSPGLKGKRIVIDPGHGGSDPGAIGNTGLKEKDVNLAIATKLKSLLETKGATVYMTRVGDTDALLPPGQKEKQGELETRAAWAGAVQADCMISVHNNANPDSSMRGTSVYLAKSTPNTASSTVLAQAVQEELSRALNSENRGIRFSNLYVPRESGVPCIIAEVLFVSNPSDEALLKLGATQDKAAQGIAAGIERFFQ